MLLENIKRKSFIVLHYCTVFVKKKKGWGYPSSSNLCCSRANSIYSPSVPFTLLLEKQERKEKRTVEIKSFVRIIVYGNIQIS